LLVGDAADFTTRLPEKAIYAALHGGELAAAHAMGALESGPIRRSRPGAIRSRA